MSKAKRAEQYTTHLHAIRLVEMLRLIDKAEIIWSCPASVAFGPCNKFLFEKEFNIHEDPVESPECQVCKAFLDVPIDTEACPCDHLGHDEAMELTKKKLKEGGYLDE